jgi:glycerol-3-phosphate dehydrogenase (NAD(P)+)
MIGVAGAGAFGTALAITLAQAGRDVTLWARDADHVATMTRDRQNARYLAAIPLPENIRITGDSADLALSETILLAMPMQSLRGFLGTHGHVIGTGALVACCKGIDLDTLRGPTATIRDFMPQTVTAILTGPSFAADIAQGLPTALTLGCYDPLAAALQAQLSTPTLRLYRTDDVIGAELGGALKNVIAIAAGLVIGAGLGNSARAALMTRGFAEMTRFATRCGARADTLGGLSGLGDLVLTCTSQQSRNFQYGLAIGSGVPQGHGKTIEGIATAAAVMRQAQRFAMAAQMPITAMVTQVTTGQIGLDDAILSLMSRPLKEE